MLTALYILLGVLAVLVVLAMIDMVMYAKIAEEICPDDRESERWVEWKHSPDGRIARLPMGALYLWLRDHWKDRTK